MSDVEWLRDAFAQRPRSESPEQAPTAEEIWDAVNAEADPADVEALVARAVEDPELAEEWRMAVHAKQAMDATDQAPHEPENQSRAWLWVVAAAAAAAVVFALTRPSPPAPEDTTPQVRGGPADNIWGIDPSEPTVDRTLKWNAVEGARGYRVQLFDERLGPLYESPELSSPQFEIPPELSGTLRWQVQALLESGETRRSPTFSAQLDP